MKYLAQDLATFVNLVFRCQKRVDGKADVATLSRPDRLRLGRDWVAVRVKRRPVRVLPSGVNDGRRIKPISGEEVPAMHLRARLRIPAS